VDDCQLASEDLKSKFFFDIYKFRSATRCFKACFKATWVDIWRGIHKAFCCASLPWRPHYALHYTSDCPSIYTMHAITKHLARVVRCRCCHRRSVCLSVRHTSEPHQIGSRFRNRVWTVWYPNASGFFTSNFVGVGLGPPEMCQTGVPSLSAAKNWPITCGISKTVQDTM